MPPHAANTAPRGLALFLTGGGCVGLLASTVLLIERLHVLEDPAYIPSCSINPVLSCGSVMTSSQAEAFGFPNPVLGVVGFTVVMTTGVVLLASASLPRWYWQGLQVGVTFGITFIHWLIFQSLYRIGALCPYCMVVWVVTIPLFIHITAANIAAGRLTLGTAVPRLLTGYRGAMLTAWFVMVTGLIAKRFWTYWVTVLP